MAERREGQERRKTEKDGEKKRERREGVKEKERDG